MTSTYGNEICGSRSICILMILTVPRTIMIMIMTSTVNGFFTLIFDILSFQRVAHYACRILELFFGYGTEIDNIPVMGKIGDVVTVILKRVQ